MNKSAEIRRLAAAGVSTADIARKLGIRYQFAYNVVGAAGSGGASRTPRQRTKQPAAKPPLRAQLLLDSGFTNIGQWRLTPAGGIELSAKPPPRQGVYAFSKEGVVQYVGVATMGLAKRIYFYARPGVSQKTSIRLNQTIKELLTDMTTVDVLIATPEDLEWNGLPVHGSAGLELGLIKAFDLPWNMRSSN